MNDYDKCKCKRCGKECGRIYIARTRIGEYCINEDECLVALCSTTKKALAHSARTLAADFGKFDPASEAHSFFILPPSY